MAPTVHREAGFRFYFFSREERRPHVHVQHAEGEAKFWLEPAVALAENLALPDRLVRLAHGLIEEHRDELLNAWRYHFGIR